MECYKISVSGSIFKICLISNDSTCNLQHINQFAKMTFSEKYFLSVLFEWLYISLYECKIWSWLQHCILIEDLNNSKSKWNQLDVLFCFCVWVNTTLCWFRREARGHLHQHVCYCCTPSPDSLSQREKLCVVLGDQFWENTPPPFKQKFSTYILVLYHIKHCNSRIVHLRVSF